MRLQKLVVHLKKVLSITQIASPICLVLLAILASVFTGLGTDVRMNHVALALIIILAVNGTVMNVLFISFLVKLFKMIKLSPQGHEAIKGIIKISLMISTSLTSSIAIVWASLIWLIVAEAGAGSLSGLSLTRDLGVPLFELTVQCAYVYVFLIKDKKQEMRHLVETKLSTQTLPKSTSIIHSG